MRKNNFYLMFCLLAVFAGCSGNSLNSERKSVKLNDDFYPPLIEMNEDKMGEINPSLGLVEGTQLEEDIKVERQNINIKVWEIPTYNEFMKGDVPPTVHPNLWRMEKLNNYNGIYQAYPAPVEGSDNKNGLIYQVRSYDICTMSFIKGKKGWIVIDPLTSAVAAKLAWENFRKYVDPQAKISAVLITHSHVDHYMGLIGIVDPNDILYVSQERYSDRMLRDGKVLVVAPNGFYEEAISENLYLGNSMERRAAYMYGMYLPKDELGQVGAGLGKAVGYSSGKLIKPSFELKGEKDNIANLTIDGLSITFQDVPGTEAPAEFHVLLNDYKVLCPGENVSYTMHNLLTPRGAKVRDPKAFALAIDQAINIVEKEWNGTIDAIIGVHHWPTWGTEKCMDMLEKQRDMYYFFNDQVIRLMNKGMNMEEIAEIFYLPESLAGEYYNRGYYGTLNHNAKAVFQRYAGWWDGNPANYFKYPDAEVAKRMVNDMGGEKALLRKAKKYFKKGDYRWTIELTRHLVFNNPENEEARYLQADAFEQLAYSFEAATWRNIFLSAAFELRHIPQTVFKGTPEEFVAKAALTLVSLTPHYIFEYYSILLDGFKAQGVDQMWCVKIGEEVHQIHLKNGVLHHKQLLKATPDVIEYADVEEFSMDFLKTMISIIKNDGTDHKLKDLYTYFDTFNLRWNIIEPLE